MIHEYLSLYFLWSAYLFSESLLLCFFFELVYRTVLHVFEYLLSHCISEYHVSYLSKSLFFFWMSCLGVVVKSFHQSFFFFYHFHDFSFPIFPLVIPLFDLTYFHERMIFLFFCFCDVHDLKKYFSWL